MTREVVERGSLALPFLSREVRNERATGRDKEGLDLRLLFKRAHEE